MIELSPEEIAAAAGAEIVARGDGGRPSRAIIDSREAGEGGLFFGLAGENADGGAFAWRLRDMTGRAGPFGSTMRRQRRRRRNG